MYWSDWGKNPKISRCGMNGEHHKDIITENLVWPNGLTLGKFNHLNTFAAYYKTKQFHFSCVLPYFLLCWAFKCFLQYIFMATFISDFVDQKLFWIDAKLNSIMTADVDGKNRRTVLHNAQYIQHPFAITVFEVRLFSCGNHALHIS